MANKNSEIKEKFKKLGIPQWQVAEAIGISGRTLIVWLRSELSPGHRRLIEGAIEKIKNSEE